jgi:hypothetical protein
MLLAMGVIGGCAAAALMWWGQAPLLTALERPPTVEGQPGQLVHPLYLQLDTPAPAPSGANDDSRWALESVTVELDGQRLVEEAAPVASNEEPMWQGEVAPGPHTLLALFVFRREGAAEDDPTARVQVERPQIFQARPGHPLALDLRDPPPSARR